MVDVYRSLNEVSSLPRINFLVWTFAISDLYKNDEILADKEMNRLSVNP